MEPRDRLDPRNIELMDPEMVPILQAMTPAQRIAGVYRLYQGGLKLGRATVRSQHPEWDDEQIEHEVRLRMTGARSKAHFAGRG